MTFGLYLGKIKLQPVHRYPNMVRLSHSHGGNTGSNPVGNAKYFNMLRIKGGNWCPACVLAYP